MITTTRLLIALLAALPAALAHADEPNQPQLATPTALPAAPTTTATPDAVRAAFGDPAARARLLERSRAALPEIEAQMRRLEAALARLRRLEREIAPRRAARRHHALELPWYETPLAEAERRIAAGDPLGALHLLDAIAALEPPPTARRRLAALRLRARNDYVQLALVEAHLHPTRTSVPPDAPVALVLELRNRASDPLTLREGEQTRWPGRLEIEVLVANPAGDIFRHRVVRTLAVEIPRTLEPGKPWRTPITARLPGDTFGPEALRRVSVRGLLQPGQIRRGEETIAAAVLLPPVTLHVLPRGTPTPGANALAELQLALQALRSAPDGARRADAERRVFYTATLAPAPQQRAIVHTLFPLALRKRTDDPAAPIARTALRVLTDHPELRDRRDWLRHGLRAIGARSADLPIPDTAGESD